MDFVLDKLFIGDFAAASNLYKLKSQGISHILTVAGHLNPVFPKMFKYKVVKVDDLPSTNLSPYFEEVIKYIEEARTHGGILVHCFAGVSRSATCVIAYLMAKFNAPFEDCFTYLSSKRNIVFPNIGFQRQLQNFETYLKTHPMKLELFQERRSPIRNSITSSSHIRSSSATPKTPQKTVLSSTLYSTKTMPSSPKPEPIRAKSQLPKHMHQSQITFTDPGKPTNESAPHIDFKPYSNPLKIDYSQRQAEFKNKKFGQFSPSSFDKSKQKIGVTDIVAIEKALFTLLSPDKPVNPNPDKPSSRTPEKPSNRTPDKLSNRTPDLTPKKSTNDKKVIAHYGTAPSRKHEEQKSPFSSEVSRSIGDIGGSNYLSRRKMNVYSCKLCRTILFDDNDVSVHSKPVAPSKASHKSILNIEDNNCHCFFIQKKEWIDYSSSNKGKITCPKKTCCAKLGFYSWSGAQCSCGKYVSPAFQVFKANVDQVLRYY